MNLTLLILEGEGEVSKSSVDSLRHLPSLAVTFWTDIKHPSALYYLWMRVHLASSVNTVQTYHIHMLSATGQSVTVLDTCCNAASFILHQHNPLVSSVCVCVRVCVFHYGRRRKIPISLVIYMSWHADFCYQIFLIDRQLELVMSWFQKHL